MNALPLPGPEKGYCGGRHDDCKLCRQGDEPLFGTLLKPSRDGKRRVKGCGDPVARGKRNRAKGDSKARRARKVLSLSGPATRHEELWRGGVLTEIKAGRAGGANQVWTQYRNSRAQAEASRAIGDHRPFVAAFCPDGTSHTLIVIRDDDLLNVIAAYAEQLA